MYKKGVTPVIATVLLIGIVMALAMVVFFWFKGFTQESITKFGGENVQMVCNDVKFAASYSPSDGILAIANKGNVPIYNFNVQIDQSGGEYSTKQLDKMVSNWPSGGMGQNGAFAGNIKSQISGGVDVILTPILLGSVSNGDNKTFTCPTGQTGQNVSLS